MAIPSRSDVCGSDRGESGLSFLEINPANVRSMDNFWNLHSAAFFNGFSSVVLRSNGITVRDG